MIYNGLIDKNGLYNQIFLHFIFKLSHQSQKYYYKSQTYMAAVLRMTQLLSHMFSFTLSLCFHSFSFLSPLYVFILKLCFCVWLIFLPLVFLSFSLFPFPFFLVSLLSCRCSWAWKMDGPSHALITQTSWCQYSASFPLLWLLHECLFLPVILCWCLCFVVTQSGSSVSSTVVSLLLSPLLLLLLW